MLKPYEEFVKKYGDRPPDIVCVITQQDTLQAVGKWLEQNTALWTHIGLNGGDYYVITLSPEFVNNTIQALQQGKFPNEPTGLRCSGLKWKEKE